MGEDRTPAALGRACRIVGAYISQHSVRTDDVLEMLRALIRAGAEIDRDATAAIAPARPIQVPAVPIETSVGYDYIACLEDGLRFRSLRRHLNQKYGLSPDGYRARWGLPATYPMVAPGYAQLRSDIAKAREQRKRDEAAASSATARRTKTPEPQS